MKTLIIILAVAIIYVLFITFRSSDEEKKKLKEALQELSGALDGLYSIAPGVAIAILTIICALVWLLVKIFP